MAAMSEKKTTKRGRVAAVLGMSVLMPVLSAGFLAAPASADADVKKVCKSNAFGYVAKWGPVSDECSYTSPASKWDGKVTIEWNSDANANQLVCVEARMGKAKNPDKWQSLGCGTRGAGEVRWPKNTASKLEVRAKTNSSAVAKVTYSI